MMMVRMTIIAGHFVLIIREALEKIDFLNYVFDYLSLNILAKLKG